MNRFSRCSRRVLGVASVILLATFLAVPVALAYEGREGDKIVIEADEVIEDDLYVGAGEFTLDGTVKGDLIVAGGTIEINGTVEGDLWAAGQTVIVDGIVGDDVRIAGYSLVFSGEAGDDLLGGAFSLEAKGGSTVGGDLLYGGYQTILGSDVAGDVGVGGAAVQITGSIDGDVNVDVSGVEPGQPSPFMFPFAPNLPPVPSVPAGLRVDEDASIGGDLKYTANSEVDVPSRVVAGNVRFTQYVPQVGPQAEPPSPAVLVLRWFVRQARRLATLLLVGAAMMWLVPDWTRRLASIVRTKPLPSLGWGFVTTAVSVLGIPLLAIVTLVLSVVALGWPFFVLGGTATSAAATGFAGALYVAAITISLVLGQLFFKLFKSKAAEHRWWPMLLGVFVYVVITAVIQLVPCLGFPVVLAINLFGLGAVWIWGRNWLQSRKPTAPAGEGLAA